MSELQILKPRCRCRGFVFVSALKDFLEIHSAAAEQRDGFFLSASESIALS
jgi:hypothetical protein